MMCLFYDDDDDDDEYCYEDGSDCFDVASDNAYDQKDDEDLDDHDKDCSKKKIKIKCVYPELLKSGLFLQQSCPLRKVPVM